MAGAFAASCAPSCASAQDARPVDPLVVTATRVEEQAFDLPVSIDSVGVTRIQQGSTADQLVGVPLARAGLVGSESLELRTGPADLIARIRRASKLRRARHTSLPGQYSSDDARRPGTDGKLQPCLGAAHRSAARAVFDVVRKRLRRRGLDIHGGRDADADERSCKSSAAPSEPGTRSASSRATPTASTTSSARTPSGPTATAAITAKRRATSSTPSLGSRSAATRA